MVCETTRNYASLEQLIGEWGKNFGKAGKRGERALKRQ